MYNDIEEIRREIKAFREKIADASVLADTIRKNDAEIIQLKKELDENKRLVRDLEDALSEHKEQIRRHAHPWRKK